MKRFLNIPLFDWGWLGALALWRLFIITRYGLGVDEAHYVLYGIRIDWSYFDHPPLTGWIEGLFYFIFGKHEWVARLPAVICGLISSLFIYRLTEKISNRESGARWSTLALNASFLPAALWVMFLPDTLLFVLVLWLVTLILKILDKNKLTLWLQLGLCMGLCGLSKYTAIFLVISLLGIIFSEKAWKKIKLTYVLPAVIIALICVAPVFYWNMKHHWVSLVYQQNHVMGGADFDLKNFFVFWLTQILAFSPFVLLPSAYWIFRTRRFFEVETRVALWVALPSLFFFTYTALKDEVLPHWTMMGWGLFIPVGVALGLREDPCRKTKWAIKSSLALLIFAMLELSFQFIRFPPYQSPYADLIGWPQLHDELKEILKTEKSGTYTLGVPNWTLGSRANYYLADLSKVYVLDERFDQFDLWEGEPPKTPNILVLEWRGFTLSPSALHKCSKFEFVKEKIFLLHDSPVNSVRISWCRRWAFLNQESIEYNLAPPQYPQAQPPGH